MGPNLVQKKKKTVLNCENSGTLSRLLVGILSTTPNIDVIIKGDHSLNKRNMKKLIKLMNSFGAEFSPIKKENFPLRLISSEIPLGINYKAGVSAQLKSAAILAGLNSYGQTFIEEKIKSRDHTENMLKANKKSISVKKGDALKVQEFTRCRVIKSYSPYSCYTYIDVDTMQGVHECEYERRYASRPILLLLSNYYPLSILS